MWPVPENFHIRNELENKAAPHWAAFPLFMEVFRDGKEKVFQNK
jgi:hypothetical protein